MPDKQRDGAFMRSDLHSAAEEFVIAISEHAETIWESDDIDALTESLTEAAFIVLRDEGASFAGLHTPR